MNKKWIALLFSLSLCFCMSCSDSEFGRHPSACGSGGGIACGTDRRFAGKRLPYSGYAALYF